MPGPDAWRTSRLILAPHKQEMLASHGGYTAGMTAPRMPSFEHSLRAEPRRGF
ncbi:hypothetical protein SS05631_c18760 [Sinorhizobium sp. CCBAU 05631]|nr:hypothetical protein SS05631_c18760 [Sinorhizobium sp. CCBAU 05631]